MRGALALAFLASLVLAGCTSNGGSNDGGPAGGEAGTTASAPYVQAAVPIRFAVGDSENNLTGESHFVITSQAVTITGSNEGEDDVDLTSIVPANAPVEMSIKVYGARAAMQFTDASVIGAPSGGFGDYDGTSTNFGIIVTRADSGQVILRVFNPGGFGPPPEPNPSARWEASSVVRAGLLVPGIPASLPLKPGDTLNLTGDGVDEVILIAPDGSRTRDSTSPFQVTANGTVGSYTLLMAGKAAATVYGPNVTMVAKRISFVEGEPHPLTSGSPTTWSFTADTVPLAVGLVLGEAPTAAMFTVAPMMTQYALSLTGPGGIAFIDETQQCTPSCGFVLLSSGLQYDFASEYLDERLQAGQYDVSVQYTGNGMQAWSWTIVIL